MQSGGLALQSPSRSSPTPLLARLWAARFTVRLLHVILHSFVSINALISFISGPTDDIFSSLSLICRTSSLEFISRWRRRTQNLSARCSAARHANNSENSGLDEMGGKREQ